MVARVLASSDELAHAAVFKWMIDRNKANLILQVEIFYFPKSIFSEKSKIPNRLSFLKYASSDSQLTPFFSNLNIHFHIFRANPRTSSSSCSTRLTVAEGRDSRTCSGNSTRRVAITARLLTNSACSSMTRSEQDEHV